MPAEAEGAPRGGWESRASQIANRQVDIDALLFGGAANDEKFSEGESGASPSGTLGRTRPTFRVIEGGVHKPGIEPQQKEEASAGNLPMAEEVSSTRETQEAAKGEVNEAWTLERAEARAEQIKNTVEAKIPNILSVLQTEHGPDFLNAHAAASDLDASMSPEMLGSIIEKYEAAARELGVDSFEEVNTEAGTESKITIEDDEEEDDKRPDTPPSTDPPIRHDDPAVGVPFPQHKPQETVPEETPAVGALPSDVADVEQKIDFEAQEEVEAGDDVAEAEGGVNAFPGRADGRIKLEEEMVPAKAEQSESLESRLQVLAEQNGLTEGTAVSLEELIAEATSILEKRDS